MLTAAQAVYFAHELTVRRNEGTAQVAAGVFDSHADLNPHQIDAAVFALDRSGDGGVILADEIGLGKTVEVGTVLSQLRKEGVKRVLVICSISIRKQWAGELKKFFSIDSRILDESTFGDLKNRGESPLDFDGVVILSFQFAYKIASQLAENAWDRIVIDEAHKLRNLHKPGNRVGKTLKDALAGFKKILITSSPISQSLLDLYSLVQLLDDEVFGGVDVFNENYIRKRRPDFDDLKARISPFLKRTLRKDVAQYLRFAEEIEDEQASPEIS